MERIPTSLEALSNVRGSVIVSHHRTGVDLDESTRRLLDAAAGQDLNAIARALEDRAAALQAGATVTPEVYEMGERAAAAIAQLKHDLASGHAHLNQIQQWCRLLPGSLLLEVERS